MICFSSAHAAPKSHFYLVGIPPLEGLEGLEGRAPACSRSWKRPDRPYAAFWLSQRDVPAGSDAMEGWWCTDPGALGEHAQRCLCPWVMSLCHGFGWVSCWLTPTGSCLFPGAHHPASPSILWPINSLSGLCFCSGKLQVASECVQPRTWLIWNHSHIWNSMGQR